MIEIPLHSGLVLDTEYYDRLTMLPLTTDQKDVLGTDVANRVKQMIHAGELKPLSIHHAKALESFLYLREIAVASITFLGERPGPFTWDDVCTMTAADWWCVLAACAELDELAHGCVSVMAS